MSNNLEGGEPKKIKKLSPSRIESLHTCSWSFWTAYHLKISDDGNLGSDTGSALHSVAETLLKGRKKHEWKVKKIIEENDICAVPSVDRYLKTLCKKNNRDYEDVIINKDKSALITVREYVRPMLLTCLKSNFYGNEGEEALVELEHEVDFSNPEREQRFIIRGFIDRLFIKRDKRGVVKSVRVEDLKSSKSKFTGEKINCNTQSIVYQMFAKDKYPKATDISMRFIFLQFPRNPILDAPTVDDDVIEGFRDYLTALFHKVNNFTIEDAYANFAKDNGGHFLCGDDGKQCIRCLKTKRKTETQFDKWKCPVKDPFEYFALMKANGEVLRTAKKQENLNLTKEENLGILGGELKLEKKMYHGCPAHHKQPHEND